MAALELAAALRGRKTDAAIPRGDFVLCDPRCQLGGDTIEHQGEAAGFLEPMRILQDPKGVDAKTAMPNTGVTPSDARHIAAYLYTLK